MTDVALACGLADQSHFTRVFARMTGIARRLAARAITGQGLIVSGPHEFETGSAVLHEPSGCCRKMLFCALQISSNLRFLARVRTQTGGHPAYGAITVADENLKQSEQAT